MRRIYSGPVSDGRISAFIASCLFFNTAERAVRMLLIYMRLLSDKQLTGDKQQFDSGSLAARVNEQRVAPTS